ncbi:MAG: sulfotransferase family protein [Bacteroidota bacterium]
MKAAPLEMEEKVFGIGLHKTGTTTLGSCLRILGYTPHVSHHLEALKHWKANDWEQLWPIIDAHRSFEDWPWPLLYPQLYERYPNSKFILTLRSNRQVWYQSLAKHAQRTGPTEFRQLIYGYAMPEDNKAHHLQFYDHHLREVQAFFEKKAPDKLLVVCWERGDAWPVLCDFLGKEVPDLAFPHLNQHQLGFWRSLKRRGYRWLKGP